MMYDFYRDAAEPIPGDLPKPCGLDVAVHCFVDASHVDNLANCRLQTGVLIFANRAPILWHNKQQNTIETSTFGSEMVAMKVAVEMVQALCHKLCTFGIPLSGPASVYCNNEAVTRAVQNPKTTLAKKHNIVAYHKACEAVATGMIWVAWEPTGTNLADILTKLKMRTEKEALIDRFYVLESSQGSLLRNYLPCT
jgi:hypothetical protein